MTQKCKYLFVAAQPFQHLLEACKLVETPQQTTSQSKPKKPWHPDQLGSESSESESEVVPIKKSRLETTSNDDSHLTTINRVLASQIENLELKNKLLQQQLEDLKNKHSKPLLLKKTSFLQEVQLSTSKTGTSIVVYFDQHLGAAHATCWSK